MSFRLFADPEYTFYTEKSHPVCCSGIHRYCSDSFSSKTVSADQSFCRTIFISVFLLLSQYLRNCCCRHGTLRPAKNHNNSKNSNLAAVNRNVFCNIFVSGFTPVCSHSAACFSSRQGEASLPSVKTDYQTLWGKSLFSPQSQRLSSPSGLKVFWRTPVSFGSHTLKERSRYPV